MLYPFLNMIEELLNTERCSRISKKRPGSLNYEKGAYHTLVWCDMLLNHQIFNLTKIYFSNQVYTELITISYLNQYHCHIVMTAIFKCMIYKFPGTLFINSGQCFFNHRFIYHICQSIAAD